MRMRSLLLLVAVLFCMQIQAQNGLLTTEYFWGADPGQGNGTALVAVDGSYGQALGSVLAETTTLPATGSHILSIRAQDANGIWGPVFRTMIQVLPGTLSFPGIQVSQGEYYWDTDPGQGNGSPLLALDGNYNDALEAIGADIAQLPAAGMHTLSLRILDVNSQWSAAFSIVVEVLPGSVSFPAIHVAAAEYWFDTDPGEGMATPMLALDGAFDGAFEAVTGGAIPTPVLAGINVLWMRAKDNDGGWGPPFGVVVHMDTTITGTVAVPEELVNSSRLIIAPNPTTAAAGFWIEQQGEPGPIRIRVIDSQGRVVLDQDYGNRSRVDVTLHGVGAGLYPVGVYQGDKVTWHSVVVQ